jgi:rubredoxin
MGSILGYERDPDPVIGNAIYLGTIHGHSQKARNLPKDSSGTQIASQYPASGLVLWGNFHVRLLRFILALLFQPLGIRRNITMQCPCCQHVMTEAQFFDVEKIAGLIWMRGWKCLNCGHGVDPLIEANRRIVLKTDDDRVVCAH